MKKQEKHSVKGCENSQKQKGSEEDYPLPVRIFDMVFHILGAIAFIGLLMEWLG